MIQPFVELALKAFHCNIQTLQFLRFSNACLGQPQAVQELLLFDSNVCMYKHSAIVSILCSNNSDIALWMYRSRYIKSLG